ncbi:kinase-regulated stress-responsive transcription factor skn7 [Maudiozyma exigua]|uniref:Transcription factor n=1 Tax=Maudiozyma exigua TaxID=34358 RepID=A0A9P6W5P9_MAUEX|nr:kinase-regulated stress-responsive transcription factor skn7 [Kazachstania exigua]
MSFNHNNLELGLPTDLGMNHPLSQSIDDNNNNDGSLPHFVSQPEMAMHQGMHQSPYNSVPAPPPPIANQTGKKKTAGNNTGTGKKNTSARKQANNNLSESGAASATPTKPPSNEFVRKLFGILESNLYPDIVRWTDSGDSFVVLDTGKFTTQILPNHFKHSNFASFVRQLNKYDFHKIKKKPNEEHRSVTGELSWEFKHPHFKIHDEASLDLIKRKLSNSKKLPQPNNAAIAGSTLNGMRMNALSPGGTPIVNNNTMMSQMNNGSRTGRNGLQGGHSATRHEIVNAGLNQLGITKEQFLSHTVSKETYTTLRKRVDTLEKQLEVSKNEIFIGKVENQKLNSKYNTVVESLITFKAVNENLINNFNILCTTLSQNGMKLPAGLYEQTTINSGDDKNIQENTGALSKNLSVPLLTGQPDDLANQDQNKMPTSNVLANTSNLLNNQMDGLVSTPLMKETRKDIQNTVLKSGFHVLLVEDDTISIQLCSKFLRKYGCTVQVVTDGLSAISILEKTRFDLVLMDIVMPNLDGATATSIIRNFDNQTPIIAMTGNIDDQDLITYLQHGMNDILAKPFTRDDLHTMLVRYLRNREPLSEQQRVQTQSPQQPPLAPQQPQPQPQQITHNGPPGGHTNTQSPMDHTQLNQMQTMTSEPSQNNSQNGSINQSPVNLVHDPNQGSGNLGQLNIGDNIGVPVDNSSDTLLANPNFLNDEHIDKKPHLG